MPDRTIPYFNLILRCSRFVDSPFSVPDGYRIIRYHDGLEASWAELETDLGDFAERSEAEAYFRRTYLSYPGIAEQRVLFAADQRNHVTGSCIAWHDPRFGQTVSSLHWLVVDGSHRGKGLGRALCSETMRLFDSYPVYIHTQPWSWKAILLYLSMGFRLQRKDTFSGYENQYEDGIKVLGSILDDDQMSFIMENTEN